MPIELTEQERLRVQQGQAVDVTDSQTNEKYVLIAQQRFEQIRALLTSPGDGQWKGEEAPALVIPEGIRLSQEAFRRDLPELLQQKRLANQWVAYHRHEQIGMAHHGGTLLDQCLKRGLATDEFYLGWIHPCELEEEEEVDPRPQHFVEKDHEDS